METLVYLASCNTGALCQGVYTTLDNAKAALEVHHKILLHPAMPRPKMEWKALHDSWLWLPEGYNKAINPWGQNNTPDGLMENVHITEYALDDVLPIV